MFPTIKYSGAVVAYFIESLVDVIESVHWTEVAIIAKFSIHKHFCSNDVDCKRIVGNWCHVDKE